MIDSKKAREQLGLSINEMASAMGIHRQTWVKWERGERDPGAAALRLIGTLLWLKKKKMLNKYIEDFME